MTDTLKFTSRDRILLLAPHPDDESLGAGGLLQRALAAGAQARVIFGSDGDNNPWPQRVLERKLMIKSSDRARWGARRREEALAALARLGMENGCAQFLGFPDQGITRFLLNRESEPLDVLRSTIDSWQPTKLVIPSGYDRHPDHNAFFVLSRIALAQLNGRAERVECLTYLIHSKGRHSEMNRVSLKLRVEEKARKRDAILCHDTQMTLSRKRFLAYVKDAEMFHRIAPASALDVHHPIVTGAIEDGALRLIAHLRKPGSRFSGRTLYVAIESLAEGSLRWALPLPPKTGRVHLRDAATGAKLRMATVRIDGRRAEIRMPIAAQLPVSLIFAKLQRRSMFFDESGWREIPAATSAAPASRRALLPVIAN